MIAASGGEQGAEIVCKTGAEAVGTRPEQQVDSIPYCQGQKQTGETAAVKGQWRMDGRVLEKEKAADHEKQRNARPVDRILQHAEVPPWMPQMFGIHQNGGHGVEDDHQQDGQNPQSVQKDQTRSGESGWTGGRYRAHGKIIKVLVKMPSASVKW